MIQRTLNFTLFREVMEKKLFLQERFIVSDVPVPSLSKKTETPTEEMREGVIQKEIEVQVHRADAEEGVDPPVVLVVSPGSTHDASVLPEVPNTVSFGGKIWLPRLGLLVLGSLAAIKESHSAFRLQLNFLFI